MESKYNQVILLLLGEKENLEHLQNTVGAFYFLNTENLII
ncbi:hypothetical protein HMPREF6123_1763 [Oribacterium sinus F0268]|uniref:Uncharacterized protein n=1 Tax=Oribacterium sinus F0268 TaxID=585501 RepID=C2KZ44_9FIRM|nr:hypothetical protein HMPREF6123_1763 [Oribacterium sinus F0268]